MPEIIIRPAVPEDWLQLFQIENHYRTSYVWQMERGMGDGDVTVRFREIRLPRELKVEYPHTASELANSWKRAPGIVLKAGIDSNIVGYLRVDGQRSLRTAWITDLAVRPDVRRQGIASGLILAAQEWASEHSFRRVVLEMQSKNYPAIRMALRLGYEFSGYQDQYFGNQDTALFFNRILR